LLYVRVIAKRSPETKISIKPSMISPNVIRVKGMEKYLVSLNNEKTYENTKVPKTKITIPGIPRYFRGCLINTRSISDTKTDTPWDTGFCVDVLKPVLYLTSTLTSVILSCFFVA